MVFKKNSVFCQILRIYQVCDEEVGGVLHALVPDHDEHDEQVAEGADDEDEAVHRRQQDLEGQVVDYGLKPGIVVMLLQMQIENCQKCWLFCF